MKLAFFSLFFCPAQLLCQPSRCPTFTEENECIRTHCPKSSRVLTAKASPELALVKIHEAFHVEPNPFLLFGKLATAKSALLITKKNLTADPHPPWALVRAVFLFKHMQKVLHIANSLELF